MTGYKCINIPKQLYNRLEDIYYEYKNTESFDEFILKCLRERVAVYNAEKNGFELSEDDEDKIKKRLKELGYLD
jgi:hypothetical protein